jgi:hypothetical protein
MKQQKETAGFNEGGRPRKTGVSETPVSKRAHLMRRELIKISPNVLGKLLRFPRMNSR